MPEFAYRGRDASGELVTGVLEGPSSSAVADQLFSTGITPVHIDPAGVPIVRALVGLEESSQNPALNRILADVRDKLQAGQDLSVGMSAHPKVFSPFMVNMLRVGELTGRLDEVFLRLYEFFEFEKKIGDDVRGAMRYPAIVIGALGLAMFIVNLFVVPAFAKMFASLKVELPLMTRVLIGLSEIFVA